MEDGIQTRHILVTKPGMHHLRQSKTDRAVKDNIRRWDTYSPPFAHFDIVSMEIHESPVSDFDALVRVKVAMGHRVVSEFANEHRDCAVANVSHIALIPDEGGWSLECPCGESVKLASASLSRDMGSA